MRRIGAAVAAGALAWAAGGAAWAADAYDVKAAEAYITASETRWTSAAATGDTTGIADFLADDFQGVDPHGGLYDKARALSDTRDEPKTMASNRLDSIRIRFFGDTAVAVGVEVWRYKSGEHGRLVWTDTWLRRGGAWKLVAAEDLKLPDPPGTPAPAG